MQIDLTKIFNEQQKLDKEIHANHNVSYKTINNELKLALIVELSELANEIRSFKFWSNKAPSKKPVILEEYVDGIHFITSLCISYKIGPILNINGSIKKYKNKKDITKAFINLFKTACNIANGLHAKLWYIDYLKFAFRLGFDIKDIQQAYYLKNQINHNRQKNNY